MSTTSPGAFSDSVDWCLQFGCSGQTEAGPAPWTSAGGNTGEIGLAGAGAFSPFYVLQQGTSWGGDFPNGMGLIYNGVAFGNPQSDIAAEFDEGLYGAGAYIQSNDPGTFTATISLFDSSLNLLDSFTTTGTANGVPGSALFIGDYDTSAPNVFAVDFNVVGPGSSGDDFAIGTLGLAPTLNVTSTPEPSSVVLLFSIVGCLGIGVSRKIRKSQEVCQ